jgi:hypothetical protein
MYQDDHEPDTREGMCFCGAPAVVPLANPYLCLDHGQQITWILLNDLNLLRDGECWEVWRERTIPRLLAALKDMPEGHRGVRTAVN